MTNDTTVSIERVAGITDAPSGVGEALATSGHRVALLVRRLDRPHHHA